MFNQLLNLTKLKLSYRIVLMTVIPLALLLLFLTQKKIFFLLTATGASVVISLILGLIPPMKIVGIELVTFSTIMVGNLFGSLVGAIFGVSLLITHLILARYHGGPYIIWILPEYVLIGVLSGILTDVKMLVAMIVGINLLNIILTFVFYRENFMKHFIFSIGTVVFNSILILKFFNLINALAGI